MPNRSNSRLQEMSGILSLPPERCHRRLPETRNNANQTALGRGKEVAEGLRLSGDFLSDHLMSVAREQRQREDVCSALTVVKRTSSLTARGQNGASETSGMRVLLDLQSQVAYND